MPHQPVLRRRALVALASLLLVAIHLGWEAYSGGVRSHHFLARSDLPSISNWWGVALVPALAWALGSFKSWPAFAAAAIYGAALALSFSFGLGWEKYLFLGLFGISLLVPTYCGEYVLGFVLGMMFTFGAVLPTIVAAVVAGFAWCVHALLRAVQGILASCKRAAERGA